MNIIEYIPNLGFFAPIIVLIVFFYFIKKRDVLLDIEKSKIASYQEICGGRFNGFNLTWPFVRVSIYDSFIVISYVKKIVLTYEEIDSIFSKRYFISHGIHIQHHKKGVPKNIIIGSTDRDKVLNIINPKLKNKSIPINNQS